MYNPGLRFEDLTEAGLSNYATHLREVKILQNSTIIKQIKLLKWFLRWATTKGYCQTRDYINFKPKLKTSEKKIIFLDWPELMTVYNYDRSQIKPRTGTGCILLLLLYVVEVFRCGEPETVGCVRQLYFPYDD